MFVLIIFKEKLIELIFFTVKATNKYNFATKTLREKITSIDKFHILI